MKKVYVCDVANETKETGEGYPLIVRNDSSYSDMIILFCLEFGFCAKMITESVFENQYGKQFHIIEKLQ